MTFSQPRIQMHRPPAQYAVQPCGPDNLLDDKWLEACPGKDPQHTSFKLLRSPGPSLVMTAFFMTAVEQGTNA